MCSLSLALSSWPSSGSVSQRCRKSECLRSIKYVRGDPPGAEFESHQQRVKYGKSVSQSSEARQARRLLITASGSATAALVVRCVRDVVGQKNKKFYVLRYCVIAMLL